MSQEQGLLPEEQEEALNRQRERIAARRAEIEARLRASQFGTGDIEQEEKPIGKGEQQVQKSRAELIPLIETTEDVFTSMRLNIDTNEEVRRLADEVQQADRVRATEEEIADSNEKHAAIDLNSEALRQITVPHDLSEELDAQKAACMQVIENKDRLIAELKSQLRQKEAEYLTALKRQDAEINSLVAEMKNRTSSVSASCVEHLNAIEVAFEEERRMLLDACDKEIEQLMKTRAQRELDYKKERDKTAAAGADALAAKHLEAQEAYNICKRVNQQNIHKIAQELEQYKAEYLLNTERLNYNLQILRERVRENKSAQAQHKQKIGRLQDVLNQLIQRYNETDKRFRQVNAELTAKHRREATKYKDLQLKFQHFERVKQQKFEAMWKMHEKESLGLLYECLRGDKVAFEEFLGISWVAPSLDFWGDDEVERMNSERTKSERNVEHIDLDSLKAGSAAETLGDVASEVLQVLYAQAPYLTEDTAEAALRTFAERKSGVKIAEILELLGIDRTEHLEELIKSLVTQGSDTPGGEHETKIKESGEPSEGVDTTSESATPQACESSIVDDEVAVDPQLIAQALQAFLEDRRAKKKTQTAPTTLTGAVIRNVSAAVLRRLRERNYWKRMADAIPADHERIWGALEHGMAQYLEQLERQEKLVEQTDNLRGQNAELRGLLNQYMSSDLNDKLFCPPQLHVLEGWNEKEGLL